MSEVRSNRCLRTTARLHLTIRGNVRTLITRCCNGRKVGGGYDNGVTLYNGFLSPSLIGELGLSVGLLGNIIRTRPCCRGVDGRQVVTSIGALRVLRRRMETYTQWIRTVSDLLTRRLYFLGTRGSPTTYNSISSHGLAS